MFTSFVAFLGLFLAPFHVRTSLAAAKYYYRAKSYKSHMIRTDWVDIQHVSSEFGPVVPWGGVCKCWASCGFRARPGSIATFFIYSSRVSKLGGQDGGRCCTVRMVVAVARIAARSRWHFIMRCEALT